MAEAGNSALYAHSSRHVFEPVDYIFLGFKIQPFEMLLNLPFFIRTTLPLQHPFHIFLKGHAHDRGCGTTGEPQSGGNYFDLHLFCESFVGFNSGDQSVLTVISRKKCCLH